MIDSSISAGCWPGRTSSRLGPTLPEAPAASSVWQEPQPLLAKTWPPSPPGCERGLDAGNAGDAADVGGDVLGVAARSPGRPACRGRAGRARPGAGSRSGSGRRPRSCPGPCPARGRPGRLVEVGADLGGGRGLGERVAGAALRDEQVAAALEVGVLLRGRSRRRHSAPSRISPSGDRLEPRRVGRAGAFGDSSRAESYPSGPRGPAAPHAGALY